MTLQSDTARARWFALPLEEQLGNAGSEVGRALKRFEEGKQELFQSAIDRALELLDWTSSDARWLHTHRLREIRRAREVVCDFFFGGNQYGSTPKTLEQYFFHFAFAARKRR